MVVEAGKDLFYSMGKSKGVGKIQDQRPRVDGELRLAGIETAPCDCSEPKSSINYHVVNSP